MENHVLDLCRGMVQQGYEVFVWCPQGDNVENFEQAGAKVTLINIGLDIDPFYIKRLARFLVQEKVDILHAHELKASVNALIAGYLAGTKVRISHTHTPISEWQIHPLKKKLDLFIYPKVVNRLSTCEVALTPSRKAIKIKEGIREDKLRVLESPNVVDIERFSLTEGDKRKYRNQVLSNLGLKESITLWGCLGRLTQEKGHGVLLDAFSFFIEELPSEQKDDHHLILAGGGDLKEELGRQTRDLGLEGKVTITGVLSHEEVIKYYGAFDYFIHPSLAEGFGLVLIEAMTVGVPVIASDLEVFKEVGEDTILYFTKGESKELARVMREVVNGKHQTESLVSKARSLVTHRYSPERFIEAYHKFYLELQQE